MVRRREAVRRHGAVATTTRRRKTKEEKRKRITHGMQARKNNTIAETSNYQLKPNKHYHNEKKNTACKKNSSRIKTLEEALDR